MAAELQATPVRRNKHRGGNGDIDIDVDIDAWRTGGNDLIGPLTRDEDPSAPEGVRDREGYFLAAYQLLAEGGCEAVTIAALCQRLRVTTGSFYYHFTDLPTFVEAFGERWQQWMLGQISGFAAEPDPFRRLELAGNGTWANFTVADSAIRAWARTNPTLGPVLDTVNQAADDLLADSYTELVGDAAVGLLLARTARCIFVGLSLRAQEPESGWLLRFGYEFGLRSLGITVEPVEVSGEQRINFIDSEAPEFQSDPTWVPPDVRGVSWIDNASPQPQEAAGPKDAFYAAARTLLAEGGAPALTVAGLCERLGVTKGAFYWRFESTEDFIRQLGAHWEQTHRARLLAAFDHLDPVTRLEQMLEDLLRLPDPAEAAFRAWAHTDPTIGEALRGIDHNRQAAYATTIFEATGDPASDILGELTLELAIGLHDLRPAMVPDFATRLVMFWAHRFLHSTPAVGIADGRPRLTLTRRNEH